eukprot:CAMPEP_0114263692 /NCGR_PEP_ID=MMETSP0058-20121206/22696_1 /TAXON_ID=36894 /ORGANISM="Pyramimonas parkeae, CCMP726" /LENGTH=326 /DNA_ID=CAMNT_0001380091 /DNA_START=742 /DNA_END=1722 /DNA_ORIENTATION=-
MSDIWRDKGVKDTKEYCSYYMVDGCKRWQAHPRWQLHNNAIAIIDTFAEKLVTHIRFVGDSVTVQHFYMFIRLLETTRSALPLRMPQPGYRMPAVMYMEDYFESDLGNKLTVSLIQVQTPFGNFFWRSKHPGVAPVFLQRVLPCAGPHIKDLMNQTDFDIGLLVGATAGRCEPVGALVMNFDLHYQYLKESQGTYTEQEMRDLVVPDHQSLLEALAAHPHMLKVYRELSPLHGNGTEPCAALEERGSEGLSDNGLAGRLARDVLGPNTDQKLGLAGVKHLKVFDMMASRFQDHNPESATDCIHWKIPGPIIVWIDALLDMLFCSAT